MKHLTRTAWACLLGLLLGNAQLRADELEKIFLRAEKQANDIKRQLAQLRFADEKAKRQDEILKELNTDEDVGPETRHAAREKWNALKLEARGKLMSIHSDLTRDYLPRKEILEKHLNLAKKIVKKGLKAKSPKASIAEPTRAELEDWFDVLNNMLPMSQIGEILDRVKKELEEDLKLTAAARGQVEEEIEEEEKTPQEPEKKEEPKAEKKVKKETEVETAGRPAAPTLERETV